jgi:hypothetical protein
MSTITTESARAPKPAKRPRMATDIPASITTPDHVLTRLGPLSFFDGLPDEATVETVYDHLDFQRGVQGFLTCIPAASFCAVREGLLRFGPANQTVLVTESLMDARTLFLTANTETVYVVLWLDTRDGPLVVEVPPHVLGVIDDAWERYVTDVGHVGPDQGRGGKYLLLPPGYTGDVPEGYFVARSRTYGQLMFFRGFIENGDLRPAIENAKAHFRVYPLARAADPPAMRFVDISGVTFNTIHANDASFFDEVARVVHDEPLEAVDPETRGLLAAIGIRRDRPFAPDERMRRILSEAAAVGNATARAITFRPRDPEAYLYPGSAWKTLFIGNDYRFSPGGVLDLDAKTMYFYLATANSPVWIEKMVGRSSKYAMADRDAAGLDLDGGRHYRLRLPPNVPVNNFWSLLVYDPQTRSMLQTDQRFPSTGSQKEGLLVDPDGSVDLFFGPTPPAGKEANWLQTVPGKGWWLMLRLYGPLEPWFDKTWRPGEIELLG